ncbi:hypothetical protein KNHN1_11370 [Pseudomonas guariconensis]|uniref:hypothetical protein n=1 Tax=Pseudomonas guariconensis TaxID=1288410 RepID=UPI0036F3B414
MIRADKQKSVKTEIYEPALIAAKSGLTVNTADDVWVILPNKGKGWELCVDWVHSPDIPDDDRKLILDVFVHYVRTMVASTASGIVCNVKPYMMSGIPSLAKVQSIWSGLKTNKKKGLNQFFGTLSKQGNTKFDEYHKYTKSHLDKKKVNPLDPTAGALSEIEFDALVKQINQKLQEFDWVADPVILFFQSPGLYSRLRNLVTNKLLLNIVRRPIQISILKWSDLIPSGASFHDAGIRAVDEIGTVGGQTLQLRVFISKSKGAQFSRESPEHYPIHLSEYISKILTDYKNVIMNGIMLLLESADIKVDESDLLALMNDMPMFPDISLFDVRFDSLDMFKSLFTPKSTAFHASEAAITRAMRSVRVNSDRSADCIATSNRIRHTVITRGAQDGLPAVQLAKITGVTVPAVRHYIDLDYKSRLEIDSKFIGNEFLKRIFSNDLIKVSNDDEVIVDSNFNPVGGARNKRPCITCSTVLGRPLGCYGCPNFRPIVEANHRSVLGDAEDKLAVNRNSLVNPLFSRSIEKLERQIAWVRLTIAVCDEYLAGQRAIDA